MMEILRGSPALSAFRINKLLARFQAANLPVSAIYAEYIHFADLNAPLSADDRERLARLLKYGPSLNSHTPTGKLLLVTPRPGTISPWSSKATDIAHNCGLAQVVRLERGVAYYVEASTLSEAQWTAVAAELHDRMMESVFDALEAGEKLFAHHQPTPVTSVSVVTAESGAEGLRVLNREKVDLVISDLRMDEMDGMQLFAEIQKVQPGMPVIILTAHGSIPDAVAATQQGVFSFLTKPVDKDALYQAIDDALEQSAPATDERWREAIVTRSPLMLRLLEQARLVAQSDVSVLINGQSGTGKEIFAQAIHNASPRNSKPFIAINCGALPEQLLESELFGHARGAFTGAVSNREGLFQAAEGGTLFLDEIGDMPAPLQVKLLRVLQERKVRPLGSNRDIDIDVRIISATHRDLPRQSAQKTFRYWQITCCARRQSDINRLSARSPPMQ